MPKNNLVGHRHQNFVKWAPSQEPLKSGTEKARRVSLWGSSVLLPLSGAPSTACVTALNVHDVPRPDVALSFRGALAMRAERPAFSEPPQFQAAEALPQMRHPSRAGDQRRRHRPSLPEGGVHVRRDQLAAEEGQAQVRQLARAGQHLVVRQREGQGVAVRRRVGARAQGCGRQVSCRKPGT